MLLRKIKDYRMRLALGQLFSVCGIVGLIAAGAFGGNGLFLEESRVLDFLRGFLDGISGALLGLSLVFNIAALLTIGKETGI